MALLSNRFSHLHSKFQTNNESKSEGEDAVGLML